MLAASFTTATILTTLLVGVTAIISALHPALLRTFALLFSSVLGNGVSLARTMRHITLYLIMLFFWLCLVGVTVMVFTASLFPYLLLVIDGIAVAVIFTGALRKLRYIIGKRPPMPSPTAWRLTRKQVYRLRNAADIMRISLQLFPALLWYLSLAYGGTLLIAVTPASEATLGVVVGYAAGVIFPFAILALLVNQRRARLIGVLQWTDTHQRSLYALQALLLFFLGGLLLYYLYDTFTIVQWIVGQVPY